VSGCENCEGGWRAITEATVARLHPEPERLPDESDADWARREAQHRSDVAAARNTWYPCRDCNASRFFRWAEGHWARDHDTSTCDACNDLRPGHRRRRATVPAGEDRPPISAYADFTQPKEHEF
jgi:hypothetical protein